MFDRKPPSSFCSSGIFGKQKLDPNDIRFLLKLSYEADNADSISKVSLIASFEVSLLVILGR